MVVIQAHPMYRSEGALLLSDIIRSDPAKLNKNNAMKELLVKALVNILWSGHPATTQPSSDGVVFDVLRIMSETGDPSIRNTFQRTLLDSTTAPYSPGFAKELGMFLLATKVNPKSSEFIDFQKNFFRRFLPNNPFI